MPVLMNVAGTNQFHCSELFGREVRQHSLSCFDLELPFQKCLGRSRKPARSAVGTSAYEILDALVSLLLQPCYQGFISFSECEMTIVNHHQPSLLPVLFPPHLKKHALDDQGSVVDLWVG